MNVEFPSENGYSTFPPEPVGGWPVAVNPNTRRPGQWTRREHIGARLYRRVNPNGPEVRPGLGRCWLWQGSVTGTGSVKHGQIMWRDRYPTPQRVHRVVWELWNGPIPRDKQINHDCDNPICVRLDHLYLGTQRNNMEDGAARHRFHVARRSSVLTPADRLAIYHAAAYDGICRDLAAHYGVTQSCISVIRTGRFVRPQGDQHRLDDIGVPVELRTGILQSLKRGAELLG